MPSHVGSAQQPSCTETDMGLSCNPAAQRQNVANSDHAAPPTPMPIPQGPEANSNPVKRTETIAVVFEPGWISVHEVGGTFLVPVSINDRLTLDFIIDSGASDVSIPADVVITLMRKGTLSRADFRGTRTYVLADGSTVPSATFVIRSLRVGGYTIQNVTASVASVNGSLLLGQSFLKRFNSWSIDNHRHLLILK